MYLDRSLIKKQAKTIISGKVFKLFIITFIVSTLTGGAGTVKTVINVYTDDNAVDLGGTSDYSSDDYDAEDWLDRFSEYYGYGSQSQSDNPIENFSGNMSVLSVNLSSVGVWKVLSNISQVLSYVSVITFFLMPLAVTLDGYYVSQIKKYREKISLRNDLKAVFSQAFSDYYLKRLLCVLLKTVFTALLTVLFIIPGIIFSYSSYFAYQIMCDYPNLSPFEAIQLSKKIIKGNRTELFLLDLSFIPWFILMAFTFGIAGIYVYPYYKTTVALYYENFRLRALAQGRITQDDFLSQKEKNAAADAGYHPYFNEQSQPYQSNGSTYGAAGEYYNPADRENSDAGYAPFHAPQETVSQQYYQPPVDDKPSEAQSDTQEQNDTREQ